MRVNTDAAALPAGCMVRYGRCVVGLHWLVPWLGVVVSVGFAVQTCLHLLTDPRGQSKPPLSKVTEVCFGVAIPILAMPLFALRRATLVGGSLDQLGLGSARVSTAHARSLRCWDVALTALSAYALFFGVQYLIVQGALRQPDPVTNEVPPLASVILSCLSLWIFCTPLCLSWWMALKTAAALASDAVVDCRKKLVAADPSDPSWDAEVAPAVLHLVQTTLPALSTGFGDSLLMVSGSFGVMALGTFAAALQNPIPSTFVAAFVVAVVPLVITWDAAAASSKCERIHVTLNEKRLDQLENDMTHRRVGRLEDALGKLNLSNGQGQGP